MSQNLSRADPTRQHGIRLLHVRTAPKKFPPTLTQEKLTS
jgi:hypothetical protein